MGCGGHMQFAFQSSHVDHWYDLDGRESDQVAVFTHPDGQLRYALELVRYREAIIDYRSLMQLDRLLKKNIHHRQAEPARRWLSNLVGKMTVGGSSSWHEVDLDKIRQEAFAHIDELILLPH